MKFNNPYWSERTRIELLSKWILIHSILYYELDESLVTDHKFDENARQLVLMISENKEAFKGSKYYEIFRGFDGTTGYDLYNRLSAVEKKKYLNEARYILKTCKG